MAVCHVIFQHWSPHRSPQKPGQLFAGRDMAAPSQLDDSKSKKRSLLEQTPYQLISSQTNTTRPNHKK